MAIRIANWNLNHATTGRRDGILAKLQRIDADVWILPETRDSISPGAAFERIARSKQSSEHHSDESWVSIWSRLRRLPTKPTSDPVFTACATVSLPSGLPLTVCGTVLPWKGRRWGGLPSAGAEAYKAALDAQERDWQSFTNEPVGSLCVAGDLNQELSHKPYYWSLEAHGALRRALEHSDLVAVTADDADPVRSLTEGKKACIDHICLSRNIVPGGTATVGAWSPEHNGQILSDHPGVWVDLPDF